MNAQFLIENGGNLFILLINTNCCFSRDFVAIFDCRGGAEQGSRAVATQRGSIADDQSTVRKTPFSYTERGLTRSDANYTLQIQINNRSDLIYSVCATDGQLPLLPAAAGRIIIKFQKLPVRAFGDRPSALCY